MKTANIFLAALAAAACLAAGCEKVVPVVQGAKPKSYRTAPVARSDIVRTVSATGSVTPRNSSKGVPVGAQVNGKLIKLYVDYNDVVTNGQVVALIDPQVYEANYKSAVAQLHVSEANVDVRAAAVTSARRSSTSRRRRSSARRRSRRSRWRRSRTSTARRRRWSGRARA